jgi:Na+-translocating ferredoxin:NAD+ oxidoreductase RnfD subunit
MSLATLRPQQAAMRLPRTPKGITLGIFALLAVLAAPAVGGDDALRSLLIATSVAAVLDVAISAGRHRRLVFPDGAILTGIIVAFVLRPTEPASTIAIASAVAIASKHLVRTRWSNVLNPAAVGLVFAGAFVGAGQSWWAALPELGVWGALAVIGTGALIAERVNKLPMVLVFLGVYFATFTVASFAGNESAEVAAMFRTPDVHAALFFALFMLDDPPTSPLRYEDQVAYGAIVAALACLLVLVFGIGYYLPLALLAGNGVWAARRMYGGPTQGPWAMKGDRSVVAG